MKKRYLVLGSVAFLNYFAKAQQRADTTVQKVKQVDIELVYDQYLQDGNNSAVTGGQGTEELMVYGPQLTISGTTESHSVSIQTGIDVISSASTDNIDFVESSASKVDARTYLNGTYTHYLAGGLAISANAGFSIESDYFSLGYMVGVSKENTERLSSWFARLQVFNDDLRWGRLDKQANGPETLIYPVELRYKEWFDEDHRQSYNLALGFTQVLSKRTTFGLFYELGIQKGLLSTPFHRVIFSDSTKAVEMFPDSRVKSGLSVRLNHFAGGSTIMKNHLITYLDDFGTFGIGLENETVLKLNAQWNLLPNIRVYFQDGSRYFAPYGEHSPDDSYYTSDYDLSNFQSIRAGMGFKFHPIAKQVLKMHLQTLLFRYSYMRRSDGLTAHIMTLAFSWQQLVKRP